MVEQAADDYFVVESPHDHGVDSKSKSKSSDNVSKEKPMSSKKRKAFEKYVARKMKKDEGKELMAKLSESSLKQNQLLKSSKTLGLKDNTRDKLRRALAFERAGLDPSDIVDVELHREIQHDSSSEQDDSRTDTITYIEKAQVKTESKPFHIQVKPIAVKKPTPKPVAQTIITDEDRKPTFYVNVCRTQEIQEARLLLPVVAEEHNIMEAIKEHSVVIISGETGSGKTTQIPQFLYEAGYGHPDGKNPGLIGVTQPRRVAAVSMAKRVAAELNVPEKEVSYQIRYDATVNKDTKVKFMTDGVLLKEISGDFLLRKYSCIIIDEAHERSLNTDILIGLLSRIVKLRNSDNEQLKEKIGGETKHLKLIIMSATLRVEDFTNNSKLFPLPPPCISVEARQYPVTLHYNRRTADNYVVDAFKKIVKIHQKLPPGNILVFMTGQNEIAELYKRLNKLFGKDRKNFDSMKMGRESTQKNTTRYKQGYSTGGFLSEVEVTEEHEKLESHDYDGDDYEELNFSDDDEDEEEFLKDINLEDIAENAAGKLLVLPLHASMAPEEQMKVFSPVPEGSRMCIVSTNVAETSLTIPGIKYVIDCGRVKQRSFDSNGVSSFDISWVSRASANQRAGRAGRTGPGHCYRLYSSALFFNQFEEFSKPEIQRMSIEGIMLQMKAMGIDHVVNFPFVTPPERMKMLAAEKILKTLQALDENAFITNLGKLMAEVPVAPRFAKMIFEAEEVGCVIQAITLAAALSVGDPFLRVTLPGDDASVEEKTNAYNMNKIQYMFSQGLESDLLRFIRVFDQWSRSTNRDEFCERNHLNKKLMKEISMLREQLIFLVKEIRADKSDIDSVDPSTISTGKLENLKSVILSAFIDHVAMLDESSAKKLPTYVLLTNGIVKDEDASAGVQIHPSSSLVSSPPKFVVFQEMVKTSNGYLKMKGVTSIEPQYLMVVGKHMCSWSKPMENPSPRYDPISGSVLCTIKPHFGDLNIELPQTEVEYPQGADQARFFIRFILEGVVFGRLKKFSTSWTSKPSLMTSSKIPLTHSKIFPMIHPLISRKITTRKELTDVWDKEPSFMLASFLSWLPSSKQDELKACWPPIKK